MFVTLFQNGLLWDLLPWAVSYFCYFWGSAGASVVHTPAAATSAAAAVQTPAAAHDTVSNERQKLQFLTRHILT